jgi:ABC-type phosphate transport system ATPase subunit
MFQARRVADRVALLLAGRIAEISARDDFFIGRLILGLRIL